MSKKRIQKKKCRGPNHGSNEPGLTYVSYDIVFEPIEDELGRDVDPDLRQAQEQIYFDLRSRPKQCAPRLEALIEKYPDHPVLYNYLSGVYRLIGEEEKARHLVLETYRKFPDYLFAKMAYVELCLNEDNLDEIPRILDNKYDLKFHYPNRTKFHITEFTAFAGPVGLYFCRIRKLKVARQFYEMLKGVAPDDPQTKRLKRALKNSMALDGLDKLAKLLGK